jgi:hypothetical protein
MAEIKTKEMFLLGREESSSQKLKRCSFFRDATRAVDLQLSPQNHHRIWRVYQPARYR